MEPLEDCSGGLEVECYAGFKAGERPLRFRLSGVVFEIESILGEWRTPCEHCFQVRTAAGACTLRHHLQTDRWTLDPWPARFTRF